MAKHEIAAIRFKKGELEEYLKELKEWCDENKYFDENEYISFPLKQSKIEVTSLGNLFFCRDGPPTLNDYSRKILDIMKYYCELSDKYTVEELIERIIEIIKKDKKGIKIEYDFRTINSILYALISNRWKKFNYDKKYSEEQREELDKFRKSL